MSKELSRTLLSITWPNSKKIIKDQIVKSNLFRDFTTYASTFLILSLRGLLKNLTPALILNFNSYLLNDYIIPNLDLRTRVYQLVASLNCAQNLLREEPRTL